MRQRPLLPLLALVLALVAGARGQDGTTTGAVRARAQADRVAVADATEMPPSAANVVVAVDSNSSYPAEAPKTDLSAYQPNIEAIAGYKPDLVVYSDDPGS